MSQDKGTTSVIVNFGSNGGNVKVRSGNTCGNSQYLSYSVSVTCRIESTNFSENYFEIHPNPANNFAEINFINHLFENGILKISDLSGREIFSTVIKFNNHENGYKINLAGFSKGIYFVTAELDKIKSTKKLIVD